MGAPEVLFTYVSIISAWVSSTAQLVFIILEKKKLFLADLNESNSNHYPLLRLLKGQNLRKTKFWINGSKIFEHKSNKSKVQYILNFICLEGRDQP